MSSSYGSHPTPAPGSAGSNPRDDISASRVIDVIDRELMFNSIIDNIKHRPAGTQTSQLF
jgi:hypothetical protein